MSRRRLFGSLGAMVFLINLGRVVYAPLLEPLRVALNAGAAEVGLLASLVWAGSALPRLPTGYLLTRVSRHAVVLAAGLLLTAATAMASIAPGIRWLQVAAFLMGVASGVYFIAANPLVSELFPTRVGRALGIHGTASQIAAVSAPLLVTTALALGSWQTVFRLMAVAAFVGTLTFVVIARRADLPRAGQADRHLRQAIREQWRIVLTGVVIIGATAFVWQGVFNFYVSYLTATKAVGNSTANVLLSVAFGAGVPAFFLSGRLVDRLSAVPYLLALLGGFVALLGTLTITGGFLALAAVSAALGYVVHSLFPAVDAYLLGSLPDRHRGSAYAAYSASMMTVQAGGSWALGSLVDAGIAFDAVFRASAAGLAVLLAALVVAYLGGRLPAAARA